MITGCKLEQMDKQFIATRLQSATMELTIKYRLHNNIYSIRNFNSECRI